MKSTIFSSPAKRARQRFQVMEHALKQIGQEQSRLILMSSRGQQTSEIARATGLPETQVKQQLQSAKKRFCNIIREHYS